MKAIRIHANGGPDVMRWEDCDLPPPGPGQVRIRHTAIALNFSDLNVRRGGVYIAKPHQFPMIIGNEAAGLVAAVGPGVAETKIGERVAYVGTGGPFYEATCEKARYTGLNRETACCAFAMRPVTDAAPLDSSRAVSVMDAGVVLRMKSLLIT